MIRKFLFVLMTVLSVAAFAENIECPEALPADTVPTNGISFCASFEKSAFCYCKMFKQADQLCLQMEKIYMLMITKHRSLEKACKEEHKENPQACIDDWNCYRGTAAKDKQGRLVYGPEGHEKLCSSNGFDCYHQPAP